MSLNPIDLNLMLNHLTEISRRKNSELNKKKLENLEQRLIREGNREVDKVDLVETRDNDIKLNNSDKQEQNKKKNPNKKDEEEKEIKLQENNKGVFLNLKQ